MHTSGAAIKRAKLILVSITTNKNIDKLSFKLSIFKCKSIFSIAFGSHWRW